MLIKSAFCAVPLGLSVTSGHTHSRARWVTLHLDNYPTSTAITTHVSYNTNPCGIRSGAGPCLTPDGIQNVKKMEAVDRLPQRTVWRYTHTHAFTQHRLCALSTCQPDTPAVITFLSTCTCVTSVFVVLLQQLRLCCCTVWGKLDVKGEIFACLPSAHQLFVQGPFFLWFLTSAH